MIQTILDHKLPPGNAGPLVTTVKEQLHALEEMNDILALKDLKLVRFEVG